MWRTVLIEKRPSRNRRTRTRFFPRDPQVGDADGKRIVADAKETAGRIVDEAREDAEQVLSDRQREMVEIVPAGGMQGRCAHRHGGSATHNNDSRSSCRPSAKCSI